MFLLKIRSQEKG